MRLGHQPRSHDAGLRSGKSSSRETPKEWWVFSCFFMEMNPMVESAKDHLKQTKTFDSSGGTMIQQSPPVDQQVPL